MILQQFVQYLLRFFARNILLIYDPVVIGITGSVGKTSTKQAIHAVLAERFRVRTNLKNYNNELGVPLTIIGEESGGRSVLRWLRIFLRAAGLLLFRSSSYPQTLILEMGADHPGDIAYLTRLAPCTVGVLTSVTPAHTEFFTSLAAVLQEKSIIIMRLPASGRAVLNADDEGLAPIASKSPAPVLTFGFSEHASVRATNFLLTFEGSSLPSGSALKVRSADKKETMVLPGVIARHQAYGPLAAICVGLHFGMTLHDCAAGLARYRPPVGRMNLLAGIKRTALIDDSYNSSPAALQAALETLAAFPHATRRIACLGDMAELGALSDGAHQEAGDFVAGKNIDLLITVGAKGKKIGEAALARGCSSEKVFAFDFSPEAGRFLQGRLEEGDVVLVKGSQVSRMEKIVKEVMAEPERAADVLVRQGPEWLKQ